ncbi:MAG: hypothetical protein U0350_46100 [Caldilineaceae bacterium]
MQFSTFSWVGGQASQWAASVRCLASELGLPLAPCKAEDSSTLRQLQTEDPFGRLRHSKHWQKRATHPVVGVEVPDVKAAYLELQAAGVHFVTGVMDWGDGNASAYFRGPDQHLYEIWQRRSNPRPAFIA